MPDCLNLHEGQILHFIKIGGAVFVVSFKKQMMMKTKVLSIVQLIASTVLLSLLFYQCSSSAKNVNLSEDEVSTMLNNKTFTFVAERVNPLRGRSRHLTSEYDVTVKNDSLVTYLPYFGRAYQAPMDPSEGGLQFTSTNFSYEVENNKNHWQVVIRPKDQPGVQELLFTIFNNGNATLNVTSTHKDPIVFNGNIEKTQK